MTTMSRLDVRLRRWAPAVVMVGVVTLAPAAAAGQTRGGPTLGSLLAACRGRATPSSPGYRPPTWLLRGQSSPPSGPAPSPDALEARLAGLPPSDPTRPDLLLGLGDAYLRRAEGAPGQAGEPDRSRAVKTLAILSRDFPTDQRNDQALYLLGYGLGLQASQEQEPRRSEILQQTRQAYFQLIKNHPTSPFVPHAYAAFGDHYFGEGDLEAALRFYERVSRFPPPGNPLYGYATYRMAWCEATLGDRAAAARHFLEVVRYAAGSPSAPDAAELERHARDEICIAR